MHTCKWKLHVRKKRTTFFHFFSVFLLKTSVLSLVLPYTRTRRDASYRHCGEEDKTPIHIICDCGHFVQHRLDTKCLRTTLNGTLKVCFSSSKRKKLFLWRTAEYPRGADYCPVANTLVLVCFNPNLLTFFPVLESNTTVLYCTLHMFVRFIT
jgi:hypothetical protein